MLSCGRLATRDRVHAIALSVAGRLRSPELHAVRVRRVIEWQASHASCRCATTVFRTPYVATVATGALISARVSVESASDVADSVTPPEARGLQTYRTTAAGLLAVSCRRDQHTIPGTGFIPDAPDDSPRLAHPWKEKERWRN